VHLVGGRDLAYDQLVIASGTTPRPDQTPGMLGEQWHREVGEFYTFEGAIALRDALDAFTGGRLVMHITELPIKCPVAPLEFVFLADDYLREARAARAHRDRLRHPARRCLHQADGQQANSASCSERRGTSPSRPTS
jgi:NADPH-dependent 2,4-dienoyl-CoA reductase/sulfur reductase-like enzyme